MKTFITTILKTFAIVTLFVAGAVSADAAQFDTNPGGRTGITSISLRSCGDDCGSEESSLRVDIDEPGDSVDIAVYTDYMARRGSSEGITGARVIYDTQNESNLSGSSYTFRTSLQADNASGISDTVRVTNLPDSYEIEYLSGFLENVHGGRDGCHPNYLYNVPTTSALFRGGDDIFDLDTSGNSLCAQGTATGLYRITNTEVDAPVATYRWETGRFGECINRLRTRDVYCVDEDSGREVSDANCSGSRPSPTERCEPPVVIDNLGVRTEDPENIQAGSAQLNGMIISGETRAAWFVLGQSTSINCSTSQRISGIVFSGSYPLEDGDVFRHDIPSRSLESDTRYYYRACAENANGEVVSGLREDFRTENDDAPVPTDNAQVETEAPRETSSGVTLNGEIFDVNTTHAVYFAVSNSRSVSCENSVSSIHIDVDDNVRFDRSFRVEIEEGDLEEGDYYYRACGINQATGDIVAGSREEFTLGDGEREPTPEGQPTATTDRERNVDQDSAELNGFIDMNDFVDGDVFFVWGQDESDVDDASRENRYSDVRTDGDNIQKERVRDNFDGDDRFELLISGLESDQTYYYRICVDYSDENRDDQLECGRTERFDTDGDRVIRRPEPENNELRITTSLPNSVTQTTAEMCGNLQDDGGSSRETYIEFRTTTGVYVQTPTRQRRSGEWCTRVTGLNENTTYFYRACADSTCAPVRSLRTLGQTIEVGQPRISTVDPTDIRSNSATLSGVYVSNGAAGNCYFNYGRDINLGKKTRSYATSLGFGTCTHNFTQLASGVQYCVQAVVETSAGRDTGAIKCFNTPRVVTGGPSPRPPVVTVAREDDTEVDILGLGLGLSLVRLDIDNNEEVLARGDEVEYEIEWQNISELDLEDLELEITIPEEIQVIDNSRGRLDVDSNKIYYTIDELEGADRDEDEEGEGGRMTVTGIVGRGTIGNLLTADAELVYDNPVNDAQENARDFDLDEYGVQFAGQTASVFGGLAEVSFLGWLVILLGLFIVFLVARWLYLEREELRAQAYAGGYNTPYGGQPRFGSYAQPQAPMYRDPAPRFDAPQAPIAPAQDAYYEPYKPNRG